MNPPPSKTIHVPLVRYVNYSIILSILSRSCKESRFVLQTRESAVDRRMINFKTSETVLAFKTNCWMLPLTTPENYYHYISRAGICSGLRFKGGERRPKCGCWSLLYKILFPRSCQTSTDHGSNSCDTRSSPSWGKWTEVSTTGITERNTMRNAKISSLQVNR